METKTAKARVVVRNTASLDLKPEMFATVKITSPVVVDAVVVPDQAIIRSGERNVAVIALGGGYFDPRDVKLGVMAEGYVQVLEGIKEGEKIVVSSQFLIDSESNLKAAISQMAGHEGMDMSLPTGTTGKPMDEQKPNEQTKSNSDEKDIMNKNEKTKSNKTEMNHEGHTIVREGVIDLNAIDEIKEGKVFQDQMDWNVISDKPGKCPICGMTLKESSLNEAKENLIKHGFKVN